MRNTAAIHAFVDCLAACATPDGKSKNIYREETRYENLIRWFMNFKDVPGSAIFVGEAPGKKGAQISGTPFVSPKVITCRIDPWGELHPENGYRIPPGEKITQSERSATRFWKHVPPCFDGLPRPFIWNIYPFWPYRYESEVAVNRTVNIAEKEFGKPWLAKVIGMFPRSRVVAVGDDAEKTLKSMGLDVLKIPHPSRGSDDRLIAALQRVAAVLRGEMSRG